ncbi:MAG TPA: glucosamine-6-phosphate deaminase [Terriglobales bacterium]|nr:glucosamine-6-phosphate deaminase [Terriglobales bacterium]
MRLQIFDDKLSLGKAAAEHAAASIRQAISAHGCARTVAATGVSQFEFLEALTGTDGIAWTKIELFHLDEYVGLPITHPASFCNYLMERLVSKTGIINYHFLIGDAPDPAQVALRVGKELNAAPVDIAFVGIGENAHLAFNDPPADFETEQPYLIVNLDETCRRQQVGEGWFRDLSQVPRQAISMSVRQILKAREIIVVAPEARKAKAVKASLEGQITPMVPASILRTHANTTMYLDNDSAGLLSGKTRSSFV